MHHIGRGEDHVYSRRRETCERSAPVFASADDFVEGQLAILQPFPAYYAHMGPANLMGYPEAPTGKVPVLDPADVAADDTAAIVDIRARAAFAESHIPGALNLEMGDQVGVWAGWLLPFDAHVVLVADRGQDVTEAVAQFTRIGMDRVDGVMYGMDQWAAQGLPTARNGHADIKDFAEAYESDRVINILDVRAPNEHELGSLAGSARCYLPDVAKHLPADLTPGEPVWVICGTGYRAGAAVKYLEAGGFESVVVSGGGVADILARSGRQS